MDSRELLAAIVGIGSLVVVTMYLYVGLTGKRDRNLDDGELRNWPWN